MIHNVNDLNQGTFKVNGFKGGSCYQANWPDNNRKLSIPTANGQPRLSVQPDYSFRFRDQMMSENTSGGKLKTELHTFSGYPDLIKLSQANALSGFDDCLVLTEFRRQTGWLANYPEKTVTIVLNAVICRYKPFEGVECINHHKTLKSSYISGKYPSCNFALKMPGNSECGKIYLQRQINNQSNRQVKVIKWQDFPAKHGMKLFYKSDNN
jgi:hypothetical protein